MKRILLIDGHPAERSLSRSLVERYAEAARGAGHEVRVTHLHRLRFDADFGQAGYRQPKALEPDLQQLLDDLDWSEHLVLATPMWWGGLPARLKGLLDRALLPGRSFDARNTNWLGMPRPLLVGRSARVLLTSDTPGWFLRLAYRNALIWQLRGQVLGFVGIRPARFTHFSGASEARPATVAGWLAQAGRLGAAAS